MSAAAPDRGLLIFSHANGFPAATYRLILEAWRTHGWRVLAVPQYGHDPRFPVTSNWPQLRDQLFDLWDREAPGTKAHLVGHSMGGYISLLAASHRPHQVRRVVLLDSPIVTGWRAHSLLLAKATGLMGLFSPGRVSKGRRWQFTTEEDAIQHFDGKRAFEEWDPRVLLDYVQGGLEPDPARPGRLRLAFKREVETRVYNTLPHHLGRLLRNKPPGGPVCFIGGTRSAEVRQAGMAATEVLCQGRVQWVEGSHLFPMERPLQTAAAVMHVLG